MAYSKLRLKYALVRTNSKETTQWLNINKTIVKLGYCNKRSLNLVVL